MQLNRQSFSGLFTVGQKSDIIKDVKTFQARYSFILQLHVLTNPSDSKISLFQSQSYTVEIVPAIHWDTVDLY